MGGERENWEGRGKGEGWWDSALVVGGIDAPARSYSRSPFQLQLAEFMHLNATNRLSKHILKFRGIIIFIN